MFKLSHYSDPSHAYSHIGAKNSNFAGNWFTHFVSIHFRDNLSSI